MLNAFRSMRPGVRWLLVFGLAVLAADALWEQFGDSDAPVSRRKPLTEEKHVESAPAQPEDSANAPQWMPWQISSSEPPGPPDLFALRTWEPPPPPPPPPAPPPPPTPPPLPYRFLARINDIETASHVFVLQRDNRVIFAKVGEKLDEVYQIESYANGQLHFQYLPMKARQQLYVGQDS